MIIFKAYVKIQKRVILVQVGLNVKLIILFILIYFSSIRYK